MPGRNRPVSMTQEKSQFDRPAGAEQASQNSGATNGASEESPAPSPSTLSSSFLSSGGSSSSSSPIPSESLSASATNKELRRLNRALRALSASNQALAHAGSEQELLQQICDIIVRFGGYRMAGIAYAEQDEEKSVRPMAHAGYDSGYLDKIEVKWSDTPAGRGPAGTAIRE